MEIIIDISDERFRDIQRIAEVQTERKHFKTAEQIIANGTPLPKGHGDLEEQPVLDKIRAEIETIIGERGLDDYDFCSGLIRARKIIDKYKAESEEEDADSD